MRDPLYQGNVIHEQCAVVLRLAPSFFRFGSFEVFKPKDKTSGRGGPSQGLEDKMLPHMIDFVIKNYYPEIYQVQVPEPGQNLNRLQYEMFFEEILRRTAKMVAKW
jgi:serine/tyrosine/threonine adenylyltransferase